MRRRQAEAALFAVERDEGRIVAIGPRLTEASVCLACTRARREAAGTKPGIRAERVDQDVVASFRDPAQRLALDHHLFARSESGVLAATRLLPMPTCDCAPAAPAAAIVDAVSDRAGIIRHLEHFQTVDGWSSVIAHPSRTIGSGGAPVPALGSGSSRDPRGAALVAIMEALERYCPGFWPRNCPERIPATTNLGELVEVSAGSIYMPFPAAPGASPANAAGLAAGLSYSSALARASAEAVERNVLSSGAFLRRARLLESDGSALTLLLSRMGGRFVVARLAQDAFLPGLTVGFGCSEELDEAKAKAAREEVHVRAHMRRIGRISSLPRTARLSPVDAFVGTCAWDRAFAARLWRMAQKMPRGRAANERPARIHRIASREITTRDVALLGVHVVRAVVLPEPHANAECGLRNDALESRHMSDFSGFP